MGKMIKSKREWVCSNCSAKFIKWAGSCIQCNEVGTIEEHILIPPKKTPSFKQKSIIRRSKGVERKIGKTMVEVDGRDPIFNKIASSTGRVGHLTHLQFDTVSKNYTVEAKNRKLPVWLNKAWIQIQQRGIDLHKNSLLYVEPPNLAKTFPLNGEKYTTSNFHIITEDRHKELIREEKLVEMVDEILSSDISEAQTLYEIRALFGRLK